MTPRSRSDLTRPRQVEGAMPTRSARALLAILASRASSRTMCLSMSWRSPPPPWPPPGKLPAKSCRTRFGWPAEETDPVELPAPIIGYYRILFTNLASFPMKMHDRGVGAGALAHHAHREHER